MPKQDENYKRIHWPIPNHSSYSQLIVYDAIADGDANIAISYKVCPLNPIKAAAVSASAGILL